MNSCDHRKIEFYLKRQKWFQSLYWDGNDGTDIYRPNGFKELPISVYKALSDQIHKNGKVLDLGCGNGLMLGFFLQTKHYDLTPYGVDFISNSVTQARDIILRKYRNNIAETNIVDYKFTHGPFDFIFTTLSNIHYADRKQHLNRVYAHCRRSGKIILYEYGDVLQRLQYSWVGEFPELQNWPLERKDYHGISVAVINKI